MTIATTRELDVLGVPAHLMAGTDATFQGRTASTDRRFTPVTVGIAPSTGFRSPAGVLVDATRLPRGASMI